MYLPQNSGAQRLLLSYYFGICDALSPTNQVGTDWIGWNVLVRFLTHTAKEKTNTASHRTGPRGTSHGAAPVIASTVQDSPVTTPEQLWTAPGPTAVTAATDATGGHWRLSGPGRVGWSVWVERGGSNPWKHQELHATAPKSI